MNRFVFALITMTLFARCSAVAEPCDRIVSLAPSVTEVLFELGLGTKVVGVTRYCRYPVEAQKIPRVGGFYDMSLENLLSLRPTVVVGLRENREIEEGARRLGMVTHEVDHSTVAGIKQSLLSVAELCGISAVGEQKVSALEQRERALQSSRHNAPHHKTLVAVGRTHEGSSVSGVYISGKDGFYSGVLEMLGMKNVNQDATVSIPTVSPEGFMALAPEVIIEIQNTDDPQRAEDPSALWRKYPSIPAVRENRLFTLREDYASIPGPRYILIAEELARQLQSRGG
jgi:iron complex transport system substrate-binding protein